MKYNAYYGTKRGAAAFSSMGGVYSIEGGMTRESKADNTESDMESPASNASKDRISKALKQVYNDVADEPLPDKLTALLDQLKNGKTP